MIAEQESFEEIAFNSPEYFLSLSLRDNVLRKPLGKSIFDDPLEQETNDRHFILKKENEIVGCLIISPIGEIDAVRMRQVCIKPESQKQGFGTELILQTEKKLREEGISKIILHARSHVVDFYTKLSYHCEGEPFIEIGIPHQIMFKYL